VKRRSAEIIAIAGIFVGLWQTAVAADRQAVADVRCVVVGLRMIEMTAPQQRAAGMMIALYYLGRLDGEGQETALEPLIETEAKKMTEPEFRANAVRCGKAFTLKGQEMQKIGADLTREGLGGATPK
jgi:hypothetical protein